MKKYIALMTSLNLVAVTSLGVISCTSSVKRDRNKIALSLFDTKLLALPYIYDDGKEPAVGTKLSEIEFKNIIYRNFETFTYRGLANDTDIVFKYFDRDNNELPSWPDDIVFKQSDLNPSQEVTDLFRYQLIASDDSKHFEFKTSIVESRIYAVPKIDLSTLSELINYDPEDISKLSEDELYNYFWQTNSLFMFNRRHVKITKLADRVKIVALPASDRYKNEIDLLFGVV